MRCGMCGYEFDENRLACHSACPLGAGCAVICCPRCGYSTVDPARTGAARWAQKLLGRRHAKQVAQPRQGTCLLDLRPGQRATIAGVAGDDAIMMQLSQYGLLPGTPVTLCARSPLPVVQVGQTDLALDPSVAARIEVEVGCR